MAKIRLGPTVIGISGTIGGVIFAQNTSGPYARAYSRGSNPRTVKQTSQRSTTAIISAEWKNLTPAQQDAWDVWADLPAQILVNSLGETYFITGFNWYVTINVRLLNIFRTLLVLPPTLTRPAAPTIDFLELPFLDAQGAYVGYPTGEFLGALDIVIFLSQAISIGRQRQSSKPLLLLQTQNPGLDMTSFISSYFEAFGSGNSSLKGFASVHIQNQQGLRSAPTVVSFISTDRPAYVASADSYDGATNWAARGASLTAAADSQAFSFSAWFRLVGGAGSNRWLMSNTGITVELRIDTADRLFIRFLDSTATIVFQWFTAVTIAADAAWHNLLFSLDFTNSVAQLYVDDVKVTSAISVFTPGATVDFTVADWFFASRLAGVQLWDGCLSEFWFLHTAALDFDDANVRRQFISPDATPMFLGPQGNFPAGTSAICYFPNGDPSANSGFGGNFTNNAALAPCSTTP